MRRVEVRAHPGGALAQQARVAVGRVEEIVQQFAPDPLLGLARAPPGEQQQGRHHRGALQGPLVDGVQFRVPAQDEGAEDLAAGPHRRDPVGAVPYGVAVGAGAVQRLSQARARGR